jgi:hypothetical protein
LSAQPVRQREPQVGQHVLDLFALVEARAAHDLVAQAAGDQRLLHRARLGVGAVHDRDVAVAVLAAAYHTGDLARHQLPLLVLVVALHELHLHPAAVLGFEHLGTVALVGAVDHRLGHIKDRLRAAVVLAQLDHLRVRVVLLEHANIADICAAEGVNRLILVAHHKDILVRGGELLQQHILSSIGVLILVGQDVAVAALILLQHVGVQLEQQHRFDQQVVEVEGVRLAQQLLVALETARRDFVEGAAGVARELVGVHQFVLGARDRGVDGARRVLLLVQAQIAQHALHHALLVVRVVDREIALAPEVHDVAPQEARADAMKRADRERRRAPIAEDMIEALFHLARGFVRKGHGDDIERVDAKHVDHIGHAVGEHAGFAAAGAGQHQHRPVAGLYCLALRWVERAEQVHDALQAAVREVKPDRL